MFVPGLASTSPRIKTGVPLGSLPRHSIRGMALRYPSKGSFGQLGSAPKSLRHQETIALGVIDMIFSIFFLG